MSPIAITENVVSNGVPNGVSKDAAPKRYDHVIDLPKTAPVTSPPNAWRVAQEWLSKLETILSSGDFSRLIEIFNEDSWWRDILALQWDFRSIHGREAIAGFLAENHASGAITELKLQEDGQFQPTLETVDATTGFAWISSLFHYKTRIGRGSGVLRLTQERPGVWKAFAVYTTLQELNGAEEPLGAKRPYGTIDSMPGGFSKGTWLERRERQKDFTEAEPEVMVVGAGR